MIKTEITTKKITDKDQIPETFFLGYIPAYRRHIEKNKIMAKPDDLSDINGKEIFVLKPHHKPDQPSSYEKYLVELNFSEEKNYTQLPPTKDPIEHKRRLLLEQEEYSIHFLDKEEASHNFDRLQNEYRLGKATTSLNSIYSEVGSSKDNNIKVGIEQLEGERSSETFEKIIRQDTSKDPEVTNRFILYSRDLLERNRAILDLEFSQEKSKELVAFDVHIEAIQKESYIFDDSQIVPIRKRLGFKDKEGILAYFKTLPKRPVIISASFKIKSYGDDSGHYELYFRHSDSDQIGDDLIVSILISKKDLTSKFRPIYNSPKKQTVDAVVVGTVLGKPNSLTDGKYEISIAPTAIYS